MKKALLIRRVVGHSMEPTIKPDQLVMASGWFKPRNQDLVLAEVEGRQVIKRLNLDANNRQQLISDHPRHGRYSSIEPGAILGRVLAVF